MKSFNSRILVGLALLLASVLTILVVSYQLFYSIIKKETLSSTAKDINLVVEDMDALLLQNDNLSMSITNLSSFDKIKKNLVLNQVEYATLCDEVSTIFSSNAECIQNIIVFPRVGDYVITPTGTYEKEGYFETYYHNEQYTLDFWENQFQESYARCFLGSDTFDIVSKILHQESRRLIPFISRNKYQSNYLIITMIDETELLSSIKRSVNDTMVVLSSYGTILSENDKEMEFTYEELNQQLGVTNEMIVQTSREGFSYIKKSEDSGVIYTDYISTAILNKRLLEMYSTPILLTILAFAVGMVMTYFVSRYISRPIKDLKILLEKYSQSSDAKTGDMDFIRNSVDDILLRNHTYSEELEDKTDQILTFVKMSKVKKLYYKGNYAIDTEQKEANNLFVYIKIHIEEFVDVDQLERDIKDYFHQIELLEYILRIEQDEILMNVRWRANQDAYIKEEIRKFFSNKNQSVLCTVVLGSPYDLDHLSADLYTNLVRVSRYTQITKETQIIDSTDKYYQKGSYQYFTPKERKVLYDYLFSCKKEEAWAMVYGLLEQNRENQVKNYYLQLVCYRMLNFCMNIIQDANGGKSSEFSLEIFMKKISNFYQYEEYVALMENFLNFAIENMPNTINDQEDLIILKIKNYIKDHYQDSFSLEQLAEDLAISRSYASTYFKDKTNVNLSTYITNFRIMKSLELLKESDMTIQEISDAVGIYNVNTFIRLFKKYMNMTPGAYRKEN